MHCTNVNKALTTELDRYKEEETLFEQVQEKDSLMKTVSDLKNDLKMEENRNIDREIALEKKIKQLDNIIFKEYNPAANCSSMMTKSKFMLSKKEPLPTAITEGTWGFEHTKACFRDEIIPFIKELKDIFNTFNQYLVEELARSCETVNECQRCLKLKTELLNKKDFVDKETYDKLGVDLLTGSRGDNLYTLSLGNMKAKSSPHLSYCQMHLNQVLGYGIVISLHLKLGAINHLARHRLVRGLPKLKFEKDHLCSACALGKSLKKPHKPKSEDTPIKKNSISKIGIWICVGQCVASVQKERSTSS
ncbi:hypothetical protein Tco_1163964 [Tanacetum coccineum]